MTFSRQTFGASLLVILILLSFWFFGPTHRLWLALLASATSVTVPVAHAWERLFSSEENLSSQLTICEDDRAHLTALLAQAKIAQSERDELAALLGVVKKTALHGQVAHVIFRAIEEDPAMVLLDKGLDDGVAIHDVVVFDEGFLFGTVTEVFRRTAVVRLILHPASEVPVMTQGSHESLGLASGVNGSLLNLRYIPKDVALDDGDVVVTSGREGIFPPDILLGTVQHIIRDERNPFFEASIMMPVDPLTYATVFILTRP